MPYSLLHRAAYRLHMHAAGGLIGRESQLTSLERAFRSAAAGHPALVLVTGEAGIGKTRLLRTASILAADAGLRVLWGTAIESGRGIPYLPLLAPLRAAVDGDTGDAGNRAPAGRQGPDSSRAVIRRALLGGERSGGVAGPGPAATAPHGQSLDTARLMEATYDLLAGRPTLLVVDDVHWADDSTLAVLDYLAHRAFDVPLAIVATARDEERSQLARLPIADGRLFARLELGRLSRAEVRAQAALLGVTVAPAGAADLHRRTGGNPFFVEQVLADPGQAAGVAPASLRSMVLRRVDGLTPATRRALDALAIIGRPAATSQIARVAGLMPDAVEHVIVAAMDAGVAVVDDAGYGLRHPLFGEVLDAELPGPLRRDLHAAAGALEAGPGGDIAAAAGHWWLAGDNVRAWHGARAAAAAAARAFAFAEVRLHLERALATWPDEEPGKADAILDAARAAWHTGDAVAALERARAARELEPDRLDAAVAVGSYAWDAGQRDDATVAFSQAAALVGPDSDASLRAEAEWGTGRAAVAQGHPDRAVAHGLEAARIAAAAGDLVVQSEGLALAAMSRAFSGRLDGVRWLDEALELALRSGAPHTVGHALQFVVDLRALAGESDAALATARTGIDHCSRLGLGRTHGSDLRGRASLLLLEDGRFDEADAILDPADPRAFPALARGFLEMRRGAFDTAGAVLDEAAVGGAIGGPGALGGWLELARIELAWLQGDAKAARRWLAALPPVPGAWGDDVSSRAARWAARLGIDEVGVLCDRAARQPAARLRAPLELEVEAAGRGGTTSSAADGPAASADAWSRAAAAWLAAGRPWEAGWARLAEAEARFGDRDSTAGRVALEAALHIADMLDAEPLRTHAMTLGRRARIRVGEARAAHAGGPADPDAPTPRELEVLMLLADGMTNAQVAERLFLSPKTVGIHVSRLLAKLGAHTRGEAVAIARRRGLIG